MIGVLLQPGGTLHDGLARDFRQPLRDKPERLATGVQFNGVQKPFVFKTIVLAREDSGIKSPADLKGHTVGGPAGAYETLALDASVKGFNDPNGKMLTFQSQSDTFLALGQKQIDATYTTSTIATAIIQSGKYPGLKIVGDAPVDADYCAILVQRHEQGLLNYVNLFLNRQVRSGRYAELYKKWVGTEGGPAPDLSVAGVYR